MCQKKPGLRCAPHAKSDLEKSTARLETAKALIASYADNDLPVSPKISRQHTTAAAALAKRQLESLEVSIARYPNSKSLLTRAAQEAKAFTAEEVKQAEETVAEVEAFKKKSGEEGFSIIQNVVRSKQALPSYRSSKKLPDANASRVALMELLRDQSKNEFGEKEATILATAQSELKDGKAIASEVSRLRDEVKKQHPKADEDEIGIRAKLKSPKPLVTPETAVVDMEAEAKAMFRKQEEKAFLVKRAEDIKLKQSEAAMRRLKAGEPAPAKAPVPAKRKSLPIPRPRSKK